MTYALIASAGTGSRTGLNENKIFFHLDNETIIKKTVSQFLNHKRIDKVMVICSAKDMDRLKSIFSDTVEYVVGGKTRGESVYNGLKSIKEKNSKVLIHDGARPFVTDEIIDRVLDNIEEGIGVVAGVKTLDTVKITQEDIVISTPDRNFLWSAQTPQGFMTREIIFAYEKSGTELTDDGAVFEKAGYKVKMVEGGYFNKKITTKEDVKVPTMFLTGIGYDVHCLTENRELILGGVKIPYEKGLLGHSDADVLVHAIMDAILGAAALGDIGKHFPDTDQAFKNIDSMFLLKKVNELVKEKGYSIVNISAVVIAQNPKLKPYISQMNENIANVLEIDVERVNVAATTTEHLGYNGRGEGITSQATVMLKK